MNTKTNPKTERIIFPLTPKLKADLQAYCEKNDISMSSLLNKLIKQELDNSK